METAGKSAGVRRWSWGQGLADAPLEPRIRSIGLPGAGEAELAMPESAVLTSVVLKSVVRQLLPLEPLALELLGPTALEPWPLELGPPEPWPLDPQPPEPWPPERVGLERVRLTPFAPSQGRPGAAPQAQATGGARGAAGLSSGRPPETHHAPGERAEPPDHARPGRSDRAGMQLAGAGWPSQGPPRQHRWQRPEPGCWQGLGLRRRSPW
jgi:hypothetical protein